MIDNKININFRTTPKFLRQNFFSWEGYIPKLPNYLVYIKI